jgi:hypothetical protein
MQKDALGLKCQNYQSGSARLNQLVFLKPNNETKETATQYPKSWQN